MIKLDDPADEISIEYAYLYILGREAENSEAVFRHASNSRSIGQIRSEFYSSKEYRNKYKVVSDKPFVLDGLVINSDINNYFPKFVIAANCLAGYFVSASLDLGISVEHLLFNSRSSDRIDFENLSFDAIIVGWALRDILGEACSRIYGHSWGDLITLRNFDFELICTNIIDILSNFLDNFAKFGRPVFILAILEPPVNTFGLFGNRDIPTINTLISSINKFLASKVEQYANLFYVETNDIIEYFGRGLAYDGYSMYFAHAAFLDNLEAPKAILNRVRYMLAAINNITRPVKCIVVDLDNTLWDGVLAEENELQHPFHYVFGWPLGLAEALLECKRRGILLAICSKNDEEQTRRIFKYVWNEWLKLEDFASIRINWRPKSENIGEILQELNILPEHALFIDDNPLEIAEVQRAFPQLRTLTGDPHRWRMELIYGVPTQVPKPSAEAARRTELLRAKIDRDQSQTTMDREGYLRDLQLRVKVRRLEPEDKAFERALELINRTNQFNTTGKRWTAAELQGFQQEGGQIYVMRAIDRFADHGTISVALLRGTTLEQMVLSCRVFGLNLEDALLARLCQDLGAEVRLQAQWQDTGRNATAKQFLERLFQVGEGNSSWVLRAIPESPLHIQS